MTPGIFDAAELATALIEVKVPGLKDGLFFAAIKITESETKLLSSL